jgi:hypothetical protein
VFLKLSHVRIDLPGFLLKQVLLVLFGTLYFGDEVSLLNGLGILLVLAASFR